MFEILNKRKDGIGLSANQVGINKRVAVLNVKEPIVLINPMIVDGQVVGGAAHGIGNSLFEWMGFDENAQPITTNLAEYLLVTATEMPQIELGQIVSPTPPNPLGVKGVGECGVVSAPAAIIGAIENAREPFGIHIDQVPIRPDEIVAKIYEGL